MHAMTMNELLRLTRAELCDLEMRALSVLPDCPETSTARSNLLFNLRNIRRVLAWLDQAPG